RRRAQRLDVAALQRPGRDEPGTAVGNHARHRCAFIAAGTHQGSRRGQCAFRPIDGRPRRAAPTIHPGLRAYGERRRLTASPPPPPCRSFLPPPPPPPPPPRRSPPGHPPPPPAMGHRRSRRIFCSSRRVRSRGSTAVADVTDLGVAEEVRADEVVAAVKVGGGSCLIAANLLL